MPGGEIHIYSPVSGAKSSSITKERLVVLLPQKRRLVYRHQNEIKAWTSELFFLLLCIWTIRHLHHLYASEGASLIISAPRDLMDFRIKLRIIGDQS